MKNKNISPRDLVPNELRLDVYKKALHVIENNIVIGEVQSFGLCLVLPCILWDLEHYLHSAPNGQSWTHFDIVPSMFPEIEVWLPSINDEVRISKKNIIRIKCLKEAIEFLNNESK